MSPLVNICLKSYANLWVEARQSEPSPSHVLWPLGILYLKWPHKITIVGSGNLLNGRSLLCYHLAKFGAHNYCNSRDMFLVTITIGKPQGKLPPCRVLGHRQCSSADIVLVCHMILQDHEIKGTCDFLGRSTFCQVW